MSLWVEILPSLFQKTNHLLPDLTFFCIIYENKNQNQNSITFPFQYLTTHDKNWFKIIADDNRKHILCTYY